MIPGTVQGVEGLAVGDNVVVEPYFVDGDCDMCQAGSGHAVGVPIGAKAGGVALVGPVLL